MTEAPTITSIAPWFGGKRTLAPEIVRELGDHSAYWDICCGGLAVLIAKPPSAHETVIDLHGDMTNLAMVLASEYYLQLYDRLNRMLCSDGVFKWAKREFMEGIVEPPAAPVDVRQEHTDRAVVYFIVSWMGRNGVSGTERVNYQMAVRWTPCGGAGGVRFHSAVSSIPAWHERLKNVLILQKDIFSVIPKIDDQSNTAIYADPPYLMSTRGKNKYFHEFTPAEHRQLATLLSRFKKCRVVVSYYDDPMLDVLYPGPQWTKRTMNRQKALSVQNKRGTGRCEAPEVFLINGPSYAMDEGGLFS